MLRARGGKPAYLWAAATEEIIRCADDGETAGGTGTGMPPRSSTGRW